MKSKKILILAGAALACILAFIIIWVATDNLRYLNKTLKDMDRQVERYRSGDRDYFDFSFLDYVAEDRKTEDRVLSHVNKMCENGEKDMLIEFMVRLEFTDYCTETVLTALEDGINSSDDIAFVLGMIDDMEAYLDYYNPTIFLSRDSGVIFSYIEKNGTKAFTTTPGEGFYAGFEDESSHEVVGLEDSPLHDDELVKYYGDFRVVSKSGVKLDSNYEEMDYSSVRFYFRDETIDFAPGHGDIVWSGDYLFCFGETGYLIAFNKV